MKYAPGLHVRWTDKEWAKIQEIKNRPDRGYQKQSLVTEVPWEGMNTERFSLAFIRRTEKKRYRDKAIYYLHESGMTVKEIKKLFDIEHKDKITNIIHRGIHGEL